MRLGLVTHDGRDEVAVFADSLRRAAESAGMAVVAVEAGPGPPVRPDVVVAVGGDGTMLSAVQAALAAGAPVFGFNLGTIGFLTETEPDELDAVMKALADGDYVTVPRMGITATLGGATASGLNDVVVEKIDTLRLVHLQVEVDGEPFVTYRADGLIVATPTGSTAYSFSAGGPIIDHSLEALLVTPVASHSLFARTIILSPQASIRVSVRRRRPVRVSVDKVTLGETGDDGVVEIRRSDEPVRFVRFHDHSFPRSITEKFQLG